MGAANASGIAASQSLAAAGYLTLVASPVVLDTQRRVIITSAGDDSGITWTVIGTNESGMPIKDVFAGANAAAAQSNLDFLAVSSIYGSGATASTVTAGTNGVGASPWKMYADTIATPHISFDFEIVSGTPNVSIQYTQDPFLAPIPPTGASSSVANGGPSPNPTAIDVTTMSDMTMNKQGEMNSVFHAWRVQFNSGTGSIRVTGQQAGLASP